MRPSIARHERKIRYLIVGGWNTAFGYGVYVVLVTLFGKEAYWWLIVPSNIIAITQNYLSYKFLVFRTSGDYIKEYLRFYVVYGPIVIANLFVLPMLVGWLDLHPIVAQAVFTVVAVIASYIGHSRFTFASPEEVVGR